MKKKIWKYRIMAIALLIPMLVGLSLSVNEAISYVQTGTISDDFGGTRSFLIYTALLLGVLYIPYNFWGFQSLTLDDDGMAPPVRRNFWYTMKRKTPYIRWDDISKARIYKTNAQKSGEMLYHTYWITVKKESLLEGINNTFRASKDRKKFHFTINRKRKEVSDTLEDVLKMKLPEKLEIEKNT